jgi:hypothetical protein
MPLSTRLDFGLVYCTLFQLKFVDTRGALLGRCAAPHGSLEQPNKLLFSFSIS